MSGFYSLIPGRMCGGCGLELSRYRKSYCSNVCREVAPRAFVCNPKGAGARIRPSAVTPEFRTALTGLWADGITTAQIGLRLGVSKNSVVGFRTRWGLPSRGSPIIRTGPSKPRKPSTPRAPSLKPQVQIRIVHPQPPAAAPPPELPPAAPPNPHVRPVVFSSVTSCQWIEGFGPEWTKCDCPTVDHGSWCAAHRRRVFVGRVSLSEAA